MLRLSTVNLEAKREKLKCVEEQARQSSTRRSSSPVTALQVAYPVDSYLTSHLASLRQSLLHSSPDALFFFVVLIKTHTHKHTHTHGGTQERKSKQISEELAKQRSHEGDVITRLTEVPLNWH